MAGKSARSIFYFEVELLVGRELIVVYQGNQYEALRRRRIRTLERPLCDDWFAGSRQLHDFGAITSIYKN